MLGAIGLDLVGVLGFCLASISLGWQIVTHRPSLRVKLRPLGLATVQLPGSEMRTGVRVVLEVANTSIRPNRVVQIETTARRTLEPLPKNVLITTGREANCGWANKVWTTPHALGQAERYEAELAHMLVGDPTPLDAAIWLKVTVVDVYNRRYRRCCRLVHE